MSLLSENIFINGSFDVWLNGTEFTGISSATEVAGKWFVSPKDDRLVSARKSASVPEDSICEYSLELTAEDEDMYAELWQRVDGRYAAQMQRFVVFSAMVYNGTASAFNPFMYVYLPNGEDDDPWGDINQIRSVSLQECAPAAWTKVVQVFDFSEGVDLDSGCEFRIRFTPLIEDDLVRVTALKLESRDMTTDFTRRFYEQELSLIKGESYLDTSLFDQDNSLLKADTAGAPVSLAMGENTLAANMGDGIVATEVRKLLAYAPANYERDALWSCSSADNHTLLSPSKMTVNIGDIGFYLPEQQAIDLSDANSWDDTTTTDYTAATERKGKDFYIYACDDSGTLALLLSANSTYPDGYGDTTSRKIGGFHCLCADVGTISGHTLSGYMAGDILPASVWDLKHRPVCDPAGMVFSETAKLWVDIYLASGTGSSTASVYGGTASVSRNWMDFVDDMGAVGKRLLTNYEFQLIAAGSNEETNIAGSALPTDGNGVGGHVDTNGRAMISYCGCWECCGYLWQWIQEHNYWYAGSSSSVPSNVFMDLGNGSAYVQGTSSNVNLTAGGHAANGSICGPRARVCVYVCTTEATTVSVRGCCDSL